MINFLNTPAHNKPIATVIFAHGAGAPMDSDWMSSIALLLSQNEITVQRFEFPYMVERRKTGKKRPPDRAHKLEECWLQADKEIKARPYFLMGKSMGARIASHIGNQTSASGYIALGYPFHAPGKTLSDRHFPLLSLKLPSLIVQGERDPLGNRITLKNLELSSHHDLLWLQDGDHSFQPRKSSGLTLDENLNLAVDHITSFIHAHLEYK